MAMSAIAPRIGLDRSNSYVQQNVKVGLQASIILIIVHEYEGVLEVPAQGASPAS